MQDEPMEIQHGLPMDEPAIAKIHASILTGSTLCANLTKLDEGKFYQTPTYIYIYIQSETRGFLYMFFPSINPLIFILSHY